MSTPAELYIDGIKKKLKTYWAAWLPNSQYSLGDYGILEGSLFKKVGSLNDLSIDFESSEYSKRGSIEYVSESGVQIYFKTIGQINNNLPNIPEEKAGINIQFSSKGAFLVQIPDSNEVSINNFKSLQDSIIAKFESGDWNKDWVFITKIINAPTATFLISNSSESNMEFALEGDLTSGSTVLASTENKFQYATQSGDILKFFGANEVSPFFQLSKLKCNLFGIGNPILTNARSFQGEIDPLDFFSPNKAQKDKNIIQNLYIDMIV